MVCIPFFCFVFIAVECCLTKEKTEFNAVLCSHASWTAVKIVYYSMAVKLSLLNVFIQFFCCLFAVYVPDLENLDHRKDRVLGQVQHRSNPYKLNSVAFTFRYDCFRLVLCFF